MDLKSVLEQSSRWLVVQPFTNRYLPTNMLANL